MKWFAVNCIYQVICGEGKHSPQFNEQIRLLQALNRLEAVEKVNQQVTQYNVPFKNCVGEKVVWKFLGIASLTEINEIKDGVEVASKILEPKSAENYLKKLKHRIRLLTESN